MGKKRLTHSDHPVIELASREAATRGRRLFPAGGSAELVAARRSLFTMIVKNGVRIATFTILVLYVNPSLPFGRLHHEDGVGFLLQGLGFFVPILMDPRTPMIECIFTLNYEIYGNGAGSLKELVHDPAERLREIFEN